MINVKSFIYLIIFVVSATNCTQKKAQLNFEQEQKLGYEIIPYPDLLGISMQLLNIKETLLINDFHGDSLIHLFNLESKEKTRHLIPKGNGPNELISPLELILQDNELLVFCRQTCRLYSIPLDSLAHGNKCMKEILRASQKVDHIYPLNDSLFIASGFFTKRYQYINNQGEEIMEFGEFPDYWEKEEEISTEVKAMFHQTEFIKHPEKPIFIAYSSHVIEFYEFRGGTSEPVLMKRIPIADYSYTFVNNNTMLSVEKGIEVERGIKTACCTSDKIYIVYNKNKNEEKEESLIMTFDWEGNPLKLFKLDKEISCLTINGLLKKAYAIIKDPEDTLVSMLLE